MSESVNNSSAVKSKNKKASIAAVIVTVLLLAAALFFSVFESSTVRQVQDIADKKEQSAWTEFMSNVFITYAQHKQQKATEYVFVFNENELNAVCNMALRMYNAKRRNHQAICFANVKNGTLEVEVSRKKMGLYINIRLVTVPEIKGGKVAVKVKSARVGKIPLPASLVEKELKKAVAKQLKNPKAAQVVNLIHSAGFTPENQYQLVIDYKAAKKVMRSFR